MFGCWSSGTPPIVAGRPLAAGNPRLDGPSTKLGTHHDVCPPSPTASQVSTHCAHIGPERCPSQPPVSGRHADARRTSWSTPHRCSYRIVAQPTRRAGHTVTGRRLVAPSLGVSAGRRRQAVRQRGDVLLKSVGGAPFRDRRHRCRRTAHLHHPCGPRCRGLAKVNDGLRLGVMASTPRPE